MKEHPSPIPPNGWPKAPYVEKVEPIVDRLAQALSGVQGWNDCLRTENFSAHARWVERDEIWLS